MSTIRVGVETAACATGGANSASAPAVVEATISESVAGFDEDGVAHPAADRLRQVGSEIRKNVADR